MTDLNGKSLVRVGNAPRNEIDFRDVNYIAGNKDFLKIGDWKAAEKAFVDAQPEPEKMQKVKQEQEQLAASMQPLKEKAEQQKQKIEASVGQKQEECEAAERVFKFKNDLLTLLPEKYLGEGERFLNAFIMEKDYSNLFPGEGPEHKGIKDKAMKLMFGMKLSKFKKEFEKASKDFQDFSPRFDVFATKENIYDNIEAKYNTAELQQECAKIEEEQSAMKQRQEVLAVQLEKDRKFLDKKVECFKSYYDKKLYDSTDKKPQYSAQKENDLQAYAEISPIWKAILKEAKDCEIRFMETQGLWEDDLPVAAVYDEESNSICCNNQFSIDEQVFAVAEILFDGLQESLGNEYMLRSRYQYGLCCQAEKVASLVAMGEDLAIALPVLRAHVYSIYEDETLEYITSKPQTSKYAKAFVKSLSSLQQRIIVEENLAEEIAKDAENATAAKSKEGPKELPVGEILNRFATKGAPLVNDYPALRQLLNQIPERTKTRLQELSGNSKDASLAEMVDFK